MNKKDLVEIIKKANDAYYNGESTMDDAKYDILKQKLAEINKDHELLKTVGSSVHLQKEQHSDIHMGSQNHATTNEAFWKWYQKYLNEKFVFTHKIDGSSVSIEYKDGKLHKVLSRGDGKFGVNITYNALNWKNLPKKVSSSDVTIRGEAILFKSDWKQYFADTVNPRNAGNGTIMRKSGTNNEHINFIAFDINVETKTQEEKFALIKDLGFQTVYYKVCSSKEELENEWNNLNNNRDAIEYETDGAVIYLDNMELQNELGHKDNRPEGQIAWKFESQKAPTKVINFKLTIGSTGAIIPVAEVEPINIGGVVIKNVLMTTFSRIKELDVNIGDEVIISRAGDVIPYLEEVIVKNSIGPYLPPSNCPSCNEVLIEEGAYIICNNDDCNAMKLRKIKSYLTKLDIKYIGDELLDSLYNNQTLTDISDLYALTWTSLANEERGNGRLGDKSAKKIIQEIEKTKKLSLNNFIGSVGIKFLGRRQAEILGFTSIDEYLNLTVEKISNCDTIGPVKAEGIVKSIDKNRDLIAKLLKHIEIESATPVVKSSALSFCLTGTMSKSRKEIEKDIEQKGFESIDDVKSGLSYLVCADKSSNSSKTKKATKLGIKIIDEQELYEILKT